MTDTDKSTETAKAAENETAAADTVDIDDIKASCASECGEASGEPSIDEKRKDPKPGADDESGKEQSADSSAEELKRQKDQYLRLMAEFDNYKRRTAREYDQIVEHANERLMRDIIEVRENFDRALAAAPSKESGDNFAEGVKLIAVKLDEALKKHGLAPFGEKGDSFDPELHDAMMKAPDETAPEGHVSQVYEKGYKLRSKIIRHAKVVVSSGPAQETGTTT